MSIAIIQNMLWLYKSQQWSRLLALRVNWLQSFFCFCFQKSFAWLPFLIPLLCLYLYHPLLRLQQCSVWFPFQPKGPRDPEGGGPETAAAAGVREVGGADGRRSPGAGWQDSCWLMLGSPKKSFSLLVWEAVMPRKCKWGLENWAVQINNENKWDREGGWGCCLGKWTKLYKLLSLRLGNTDNAFPTR